MERNDRFELAKMKIDECLNSSTVAQIAPLRRDVYKQSSTVFQQWGNYKKAFQFQTKYFNLKDSINNIISEKELASLTSLHQLELHKRELETLKKEKRITNIYYWVISMTCLLLIGGICLVAWLLSL